MRSRGFLSGSMRRCFLGGDLDDDAGSTVSLSLDEEERALLHDAPVKACRSTSRCRLTVVVADAGSRE